MDWDIFDVSRKVTESYKVWITLAGLGLALGWHLFDRKVAIQLLLGLTLVAGINYGRWGTESTFEKVDAYDLIHYYLNAKYFDELGYYDLYPACMLADVENGGPFFKKQGSRYMAQDDSGHSFKPVQHAVQRGREVREAEFTPERWKQFEHDFLWLQRKSDGMNRSLWRQMIQDHGFNGTTTWVLLAKPLAAVVPVEYIKLLGFVDVAMLGVAVGLLGWCYGAPAALWTLFFLFVTYATRWPTISWVYLRYDWIAAMLITMVLLKKKLPFAAGLAAGVAASSRMFPALWMWGPFGKGLAGLPRRYVRKPLLIFAGGFLVMVIGLQAVSVAAFGSKPTRVHFENMLDHNSPEQLSSRRIGLALALPFRGELEPKFIEKSRKRLIGEQKPLRYGLALLIMVLLAWGVRKVDDDEAYAYGLLPFFLLTTASYYYLVCRATVVAIHAANMDKMRHRVLLALLVAMELFANWAETNHPGHRVFLIGYLAWGLTLYSVVLVGWLLWEDRDLPLPESTEAGTD